MTPANTITPRMDSDLLRFVEAHSEQRVMRCNQCGKCTAGCPLAADMDLTPRQILRAVQLGMVDQVLQSEGIRLCVGCHTCAARCPMEIDIPRVMESLVILASQRGVPPPRREVPLFAQLFLKTVEWTGRSYEMGMAGAYNLLSGHPLHNIAVLPQMLRKGKLPFLPERGLDGEIRRIFARVRAIENGSLTPEPPERDAVTAKTDRPPAAVATGNDGKD